MNKKIFKQLCMNYNRDADKDLYEMWEYNLRCYDEDEMQKAINIIIAQDKFFPTLSRVLEVVKDVVKKEDVSKNEDAIIEKAKRLNINLQWYNEDIEDEPIDDETKKTFEDFNKFIEEFRNE